MRMVDRATQKLPWLDSAFLIAVLLGPAAAYSKLYLFHAILVLLLARSIYVFGLRQLANLPQILRLDIGFFLFFIFWYTISIIWSEDKLYAVQYCIYVILGVLTVYFTADMCRALERLRGAVWVILGVVSVEIFLAILEGARLIRLPFSPYSPYRWIFGRDPNSFAGLSQEQIDYLQGVPTGFAGNPNDLAAFLVLALPLFLFARRWWVALVGAMATYVVIDLAGARAGVIAFWVVMIVGVALFNGRRLRIGAVALFVVVAIWGQGMLKAPEYFGRAPAMLENYSSPVARLGAGLLSGESVGKDSVGVRTQLILNGLNALRETYGLGVGAGGSLTVQKNAADGRTGGVESMHNFWVELLVDGGVLFAALFFSWAGWLVWRLWRIGRSSSQTTLRYLGQALSLGFVGFFFSAIGPSSVIYMLPMWMFIGLSLAAIRLNAEERSPPGVQKSTVAAVRTAS